MESLKIMEKWIYWHKRSGKETERKFDNPAR
jgi:hypothetical protein